ncbi:Scr1 family TA system antitoxin-like transcriptional regulator [Streptomyces sp900105755]|uniref:Scr1 family TA system antitoxin-like transcriptional regulator n=1 Tax=Streptomyces sp. 900105755 TaxID=3154389 RepID=UPI00332DF4E5
MTADTGAATTVVARITSLSTDAQQQARHHGGNEIWSSKLLVGDAESLSLATMPEAKTPWSLTLSEVGLRLEELRESRGLTQGDVAGHEVLRRREAKIDNSGLSRLERGRRRRLARDLVEALLEVYQASDSESSEILALLGADTTTAGRPRPALWRRNAHLLDPMQFEGFLEMERRAAVLSNYERDIWPGLCQIEDYAYIVIAQLRPDLRPSEVKALVDVRMDRQQQVREGALAEFRALVDESALHHIAGRFDDYLGSREALA